ncbi:peptidyl-prolyl cis-trans isomerase FKBP8 [Procambarus clarkii]|uniref:peptidyl-prolyl cis-trans isomerase FKBP8 n=1 Tax=Procambarus clarkii TaxID=6728 RepID=UPI001E67715F|nr:peptidyl-prolyl cis-trans isomerase FKBP8-like [Procambarus clarkii]XP_045604682.1 peptidyl-prolyl cis-trans isomerase FKBP8-like [Procambarus clarkii]XP_045604683.1 peptidyl-prolyl cis-trans isomerase FKBP8-like [Procambarus clarkii]
MPEVDQTKEMKVEKVEEVNVELEGKTDIPDDGWLDVLGSGDLKKKVIKAGIVESRPFKGHTVVMNAYGKLENGMEVDKREQLTFTIGDSEVIVGLDMIAPLMDKGEIALVYIASRFGYGSKGLPPNIPPDSNIIYQVELLDYAPEQEPCSLSITERMVIGNRKRERGNWWFNREEYSMAIQCYSAAIDFLDDAEEEYGDDIRPEVREILAERLKALNNMGAAQIKIEAYDMAVKSLDTVLKCQPSNVKALFRKGKVLGIQGKMKESVTLLKLALELEPESRLIHQELAKMREKARIEAESEKSLYRRMLGLKKDITQSDRRYPVIKSFPWKTWLIAFVILLIALVAYQNLTPLYELI